ncbi:hypothetical protein FE784_35960 [Paenibacillus hemerocallicola]|uniref:Rhamnogalacturonase A/B/Epimerase-like pectate lyase domain-containing protein n=1 Tax=Paenibacillus hemerocallicola TaxID=1172614 RepID=A0A5C4SX90_9BACL|nr:hypothetical protein FE784_35960 [Paenibacillus hemerocallicola]
MLVNIGGARFKRLIETDYLNVKWFGAKGDGIADDSSAIQQADTVAAALSKRLFFPEGTYKAYGLLITASWFGGGRTVLERCRNGSNYESAARNAARLDPELLARDCRMERLSGSEVRQLAVYRKCAIARTVNRCRRPPCD